MTLLPSSTMSPNNLKSSFSKTMLATFFATSLPEAKAILTSASLKAKTSLTPSPVMATTCPCFFRACMSCFF